MNKLHRRKHALSTQIINLTLYMVGELLPTLKAWLSDNVRSVFRVIAPDVYGLSPLAVLLSSKKVHKPNTQYETNLGRLWLGLLESCIGYQLSLMQIEEFNYRDIGSSQLVNNGITPPSWMNHHSTNPVVAHENLKPVILHQAKHNSKPMGIDDGGSSSGGRPAKKGDGKRIFILGAISTSRQVFESKLHEYA